MEGVGEVGGVRSGADRARARVGVAKEWLDDRDGDAAQGEAHPLRMPQRVGYRPLRWGSISCRGQPAEEAKTADDVVNCLATCCQRISESWH